MAVTQWLFLVAFYPAVAIVAVHPMRMGAHEAPQNAAATIWDRVYSAEQADRGETLYAERCAQCHGDGLGGIEAAPALTGLIFYEKWEGETLQALFDRVRTMPPDKPGSLARAQAADLLAHILRAGGYPAGETPLDSTAAALSRITLRMYRPQ
jgi:mono/diheme cytochrome c family protein